jgi:hypothetical protein
VNNYTDVKEQAVGEKKYAQPNVAPYKKDVNYMQN